MSKYCKNCYELTKQLDQLKVELEQEKALKETYLTCYKAKHGDIDGELFKLKQTLIEIKELIQSDYCTEIGSCEFCAEIGDCLNRKILQKISECEVENERNRKDV